MSFAAALLLWAAASFAEDFDITQCKMADGERIFVYGLDGTDVALGCFRVDKRTCEVTLSKGEYPPQLKDKMLQDCRKSKGTST